MKKKSKIIISLIAVIIIVPVLVIAGFMTYISVTWHGNHEFQEYVYTQGPWGHEGTWASDDGNSYLVCDKESMQNGFVNGYFKVGNTWNKYEVSGMNRMVYLHVVKDGVIIKNTSGYMKFDGTTFTIYKLDKGIFGNDKFHYIITDK